MSGISVSASIYVDSILVTLCVCVKISFVRYVLHKCISFCLLLVVVESRFRGEGEMLVLVLFFCWVVCFFTICSTSPPGGNQVDGLPPASSLHLTRRTFSALRIIRLKGELISRMVDFFWADRPEKLS